MENEITNLTTSLALHERLAQVDITKIPVMTMDRCVPLKVQAKLTRTLFKALGIKGVSVRAPRYSMACVVEVRLPRRTDYVRNSAGQVEWDKDPAAQANTTARNRMEAILLAAFPQHDNRSDYQTDYFDSCWSIS